jgi:hypothetical protein
LIDVHVKCTPVSGFWVFTWGAASRGEDLYKMDGLPSPVRRYAERVTRALKPTQSENVTLHKELAASQQLLRTRKNRKSGM